MLATARSCGQRWRTTASIGLVLVMKAPALPCRRAISSSRLHSSSAWLASTCEVRTKTLEDLGKHATADEDGGLHGVRLLEEAGEVRDRLALGDERVLDRVRVGMAE